MKPLVSLLCPPVFPGLLCKYIFYLASQVFLACLYIGTNLINHTIACPKI